MGGSLAARAQSIEDLNALFVNEPFYLERLATYRFKAFEPVKRQPWLDAWFNTDLTGPG